MNEVLLDIRNLELRYGAAIAVRDISLSVKRGQLVAVIGNNGAGKSSMVPPPVLCVLLVARSISVVRIRPA